MIFTNTPTKEQILGPMWFYASKSNGVERCCVKHDDAKEAMTEWAKIQVISFAIFLLHEEVRVVEGEFEINSGIERTYSPTEAYSLFIEHQNKQQASL